MIGAAQKHVGASGTGSKCWSMGHVVAGQAIEVAGPFDVPLSPASESQKRCMFCILAWVHTGFPRNLENSSYDKNSTQDEFSFTQSGK